MKNLAPVILFVYNRLEHTRKTVESLKNNHLANESELIVFCDGSKNECDLQFVLEVQDYIEKIIGFKKVSIIKRSENLGLANSIIDGVTQTINKYGCVIVLEDDLITSDNFLCFMNQALDFYKSQGDIFSVTGYTGDIGAEKYLKHDVYASYRPSSWGWGTWRHQWNDIDWDVSDYNLFIKDKSKVKDFNRGRCDMTRMLKHQQEGKNNSWAIRWSYSMYKKKKYAVYPVLSKVQNIGFGEEATHCIGVNIYKTKLDDSHECNFNFDSDISINEQVCADFKYQFSYTNKILKRLRGYFL